MSERTLMTPRQVHDFGIQITQKSLEPEGWVIDTYNDDPGTCPQLRVSRNGQRAWVIVRTAIYPETPTFDNEYDKLYLLTMAKNEECACFYSPVQIRSLVEDEAEGGLAYLDAQFTASWDFAPMTTTLTDVILFCDNHPDEELRARLLAGVPARLEAARREEEEELNRLHRGEDLNN